MTILKKISFFFDFPGTDQLIGGPLNAIEEIYARITQDIFNDSLAKW